MCIVLVIFFWDKLQLYILLPSVLGCGHERRPTAGKGRFEEVAHMSLLGMNLHAVHTLCSHLRLTSLHEHVEEADSTLVSLCGVGTVGQEDLQRCHVVVHRGVEEEVALSLKYTSKEYFGW